ncbi:RNA 2',3'-cyclic phosphodiesterase [Stygiolobus caldivivus]|uniref:RNA 2',3'-cyclic phosphodiesterase n=1 Tax=Stygiolobus caldivivus TaxID=2824673 RepID=UPI001C85BCF7|nr:RNA 2',3'-cyclic phosphodiesterase [Stygiolobus caldivivus]
MRLFIAVKVPQLPKITEALDALGRVGADVKLVEPWNIHLTLVFLGELPENKLDLIKDSMDAVSFSSFKVKFFGTGAFPNLNKPRVLWIGLNEGVTQLRQLRGELYKQLVSRGIRPEDEKEFSPHLTLGRIKGPRNVVNLVQVLNEYASTDFGEVNVEEVTLFKSTLTPKGPIYDPLYGVRSIDRRGGTETNKAR